MKFYRWKVDREDKVKKEVTYLVVINIEIIERMTKEFPDEKSALLEVERLKTDTSFNEATFKAIRRTVIEETIKH